MAKQRDLIRMNEAEISAFIEERKSLIVATLGKDGAPHQTVLWFGVKDGVYLFETYGSSQKVVNLRRDPRVSLLWEAGTEYNALRGVTIQGRAEIIDAEPQLTELMTHIARRTMPDLSDEARTKHVAGMVRKRVVIAVHPERVVSWDHRKLTPVAAH